MEEILIRLFIPMFISPFTRWEVLEYPLNKKLREMELGSVLGGISDIRGDTGCSLDIVINDLEKTIPILKARVEMLGFFGCTVEYRDTSNSKVVLNLDSYHQ